MNPRGSSFTLSSLKTLLVTACMVAGLSASSLFADPVYCCAGISALDSGYTESSGTSSTGGFAGTATYKSTASGDTHTDGGRYCQGGAVAD